MSDRGRDVSPELAEVRTVLSRAEDARLTLWLYQVGELSYGGTMAYTEAGPVYTPLDREGARDPELAEMVEALDEVIVRLERWRRTGRTKKK